MNAAVVVHKLIMAALSLDRPREQGARYNGLLRNKAKTSKLFMCNYHQLDEFIHLFITNFYNYLIASMDTWETASVVMLVNWQLLIRMRL